LVGLGGTGCSVATNLALAGVGRLSLLDRDIVSLENLHRQPIYSLADVGTSKAETAARFLEARSPYLKIRYSAESLDAANSEGFLKDVDIAVDCLDNVESRLALNRACARKRIPMLYTGSIGWEGALGLFLSPRTACLECLIPRSRQELPSCEEVGVLGASTSVIGSLAALEAVAWLIKGKSPLLGKLLVYDFDRLSSNTIPVQKRASCMTCGSLAPSSGVRRSSRKTITLCGAGEYYLPRAYDSASYERILVEAPQGVRIQRRGSSVALAKLPNGVTLALFRRGAVLIRGAGSAREAEQLLLDWSICERSPLVSTSPRSRSCRGCVCKSPVLRNQAVDVEHHRRACVEEGSCSKEKS
jgi:molybdopterin/thiamine biosynthesis adenylyltransferase